MDAAQFKAGHLGDRQARLCGAHRDKRLDFEAVAPDAAPVCGLGQIRVGQLQGRDDALPECVVAVAQVSEFRAQAEVAQDVQAPVAG